MELVDQLARWQTRFDDAVIACDTLRVMVPEQQPGIDRFIINPQGLMPSVPIDWMRDRFKVCINADDLDKTITENDRSNVGGAYGVWVQDNVEGDEELKDLSANEIDEQEIAGQTLVEHLLHRWAYFDETGKHLDRKNYTLCTGSYYADGNVLFVYWDLKNRELVISHDDPDNTSDDEMRIRAVVS